MRNVLVVFLLVLAAACSGKSDSPVQVATTDAAQAGETPNVERIRKLTGVPFPHGEKFKLTGEHGKYYLQNKQTCLGCHVTMTNPDPKVNTCLQCHKSFPHLDPFPKHGGKFLASVESKAECLRCHSVKKDPSAPSGIPSCTQCHNSYPHEKDWTAQHGEAALARDNNCMLCHGGLLEEKHQMKKLRCDSCHTQMPHDEDWMDNHGAVVKRNGVARCQNCHGENLLQSYVPYYDEEKPECEREGNLGKVEFCADCHW